MKLGLDDKTVIVTGGSGGIGQGLLLKFAREGANVVSASRDVATGEKCAARARAAGHAGSILPVGTDVTDRASVDAMVAVALGRFGSVDVLINNAGAAAGIGPFEEMTQASRDWEIGLNIHGVVNCTQAVAADMLARKAGSIINISSTSSLVGDSGKHVVHYGATKGFINTFTKMLAYEWGPRGVRVNAIAPGWIVPWSSEDIATSTGSFWNRLPLGTPEDVAKSIEQGTMFNMSNVPLPGVGRPDDIAHYALFLASDVSRYITGQLISISGGQAMPG